MSKPRPSAVVEILTTGRSSQEPAERLFREHGEWLRRQLARRFGADVAEDVVQDTWARLVARGRLEEVARPKPFLFRIAANLMIDRGRRQAVRPDCVTLETAGVTPVEGDAQTQTVLLKQIILGLPRPLREVFVLSRFEGWSYQSIAEHLNISVKTVEWRMSKALIHCAERLRD